MYRKEKLSQSQEFITLLFLAEGRYLGGSENEEGKEGTGSGMGETEARPRGARRMNGNMREKRAEDPAQL